MMKPLLGLVLLLTTATSFAKSEKMILSGTVVPRAEVKIDRKTRSPEQVKNLSSKELTLKIRDRAPASIVEVTAP